MAFRARKIRFSNDWIGNNIQEERFRDRKSYNEFYESKETEVFIIEDLLNVS